MDEDFSFAIVFATDEEPAQPHELYGVFSRAGTDRDAPARSWAEGVQANLGPTVLVEEARLLLDRAGLAEEDLVGAPTTDGAVCLALLPGGSGGCGKAIEFGLQVNGEQRDGRLLVYGLVADEVQGVEVTASGDRRKARMGENAYACELPSDAELDELTLRLAGGAVETVRLSA